MFLDYLFRTKDRGSVIPIKDVPYMLGLRSMPVPSEDYYERAFVYTGVTDATYTRGVIYQCTRSGSEGAYTYAWTKSEALLESALSTLEYSQNHVYYVDGSRADTYTADGSIYRPYKTVAAAAAAINAVSVTLLDTAAHFELCKFIINVAPGKYTDDVSFLSARYIRVNMQGAEISGNITIAQEQQGLSDYYGKIEFVGGMSNRANRGNCGLISGNILFTKTAYDSLAYASFFGIHVSGNISYGTAETPTHGTWVLCLENFYMSGSDKFISAYPVSAGEGLLIETYGYCYIKSHLAKQDGSATCISLYDCNDTYFDLVNLTPTENCKVKSCTFNSTTSIVASKTLSVDALSYKSLMAQSPTLTSMTVAFLDWDIIEKTGYGVHSGLEVTAQGTPDMTFNMSAGIRYLSNGVRQYVAALVAQAVDAADTVKDRIDLVYINAAGVGVYLAGTIEVDAVAGARTITVTVNAVEDDTFALDGETLLFIRTTPSTDEFNIGNTIALSATALYTALGLNANIVAKFDVTNPSDGVIVLTESTPGGGDTPGECSVVGDAVIGNGTPTTSAAAVASVRDFVMTDRAEAGDTFGLFGETMTCVNGTPGTDEFEESGTIAGTVTNLAAALAANSAIAAKFTVSTPAANTIRLTEIVAGGGDNPGASSTTGTLAVTDGTQTASAAAVAGARTYTMTGQASHKDAITFETEEFLALKAAAGTDEAVPGVTAALTATAIYNWINGNTNLSAKYTATNPSSGVVLVTETSAGGGDTPGAAEVTGTLEVTNGEATESVAHVAGGTVPSTPEGGIAVAELDVNANQTTIQNSDITKKRVWTSPGVND